MRSLHSSFALLALSLAVGCARGTHNGGDTDLALPDGPGARVDGATDSGPGDLAVPDSGPGDLAVPDLAPSADLATPSDATALPDLASPPDLASCLPPLAFGVETVTLGGPVNGIWGTGVSNIYLASLFTTGVVHWNGNMWSNLQVGNNSSTINGIWGLDANDIWAVGSTANGGAIYYSGAGWTAQTLPNGLCNCQFFSVWGSGPADIYVTGALGILLHTDNKGVNWSALSTGRNDFYTGIWGSGPMDVYLVGPAGIYHSTDAGLTWPKIVQGSFNAIWGSGPNDVYAVGSPGLIVHSTDGGRTFPVEPSNTNSALTSVWGSGPSDVWAVGSGGVALHSCGSGVWIKVPVPRPPNGFPAYDLQSVWGTGPSNVYAGALSEALLHWQ
jgi:hypothetical protein